jgi:hypothetical protein
MQFGCTSTLLAKLLRQTPTASHCGDCAQGGKPPDVVVRPSCSVRRSHLRRLALPDPRLARGLGPRQQERQTGMPARCKAVIDAPCRAQGRCSKARYRACRWSRCGSYARPRSPLVHNGAVVGIRVVILGLATNPFTTAARNVSGMPQHNTMASSSSSPPYGSSPPPPSPIPRPRLRYRTGSPERIWSVPKVCCPVR